MMEPGRGVEVPPAKSMSGLGDRARLAVLWTTGFGFFQRLVQFVLTVILARLLTPQEYGQYGLVNSMMVFLNVFSLQGFVAHALQARDDRDVSFQDHFTAGGVIQGVLFVAANLVALALRGSETYREVGPFLHLTSLIFLLEWPAEIRVKMLERALDWQRFRILHGIGILIAFAVAVLLAAGGAGVYALLLAPFAKHVVFVYDLFVSARWRPEWSWNRARYAAARRFGLNRLGSGLFAVGRQLVESSLFVRFAGFSTFGLYGRGVGLSGMFCREPAFQLMYSIYPVLTKIPAASDRYRRVAGLVLRTIGWTVTPMAALLAMIAEPAVRIVYGERWIAVVPFLPWLLLFGAVGALRHATYMLVLGIDRPRICLASDFWGLATTVAALVWLLPAGVIPYLGGLAAAEGVSVIFLVTALWRREGIDAGGVWRAVGSPLVGVGCAFIAAEGLRGLAGAGLDAPIVAGLYSGIFLLAYVASMRALFRPDLGEMVVQFPAGRRVARLLWLEA